VPQPRDVEKLAGQLGAVYADVWRRIQAEEQSLLEQWPGLAHGARVSRLRDLQELVDQLRATADEQALLFTVDALPAAFLSGAIAASASLSGVDLSAVAVLAGDTYGDLLAATKQVHDTTRTLIRTLAREQVGDKLVRGQTAVDAGRELADRLAEHRISAVTYANGARHGLADYADMVVRTKTATAYSTGNLAGVMSDGVLFVEVFDGPSCGWTFHDDGDRANGSVRPVGAAMRQTISHPRCQRAFAGRPDVTNHGQAERARPTATPAQTADQRLVEQTRELAVARRAARAALSGRIDRNAARLLEDTATRITSPAYARRVATRRATLDQRAARLAARSASRRTPAT
jgi:hypothetical protein